MPIQVDHHVRITTTGSPVSPSLLLPPNDIQVDVKERQSDVIPVRFRHPPPGAVAVPEVGHPVHRHVRRGRLVFVVPVVPAARRRVDAQVLQYRAAEAPRIQRQEHRIVHVQRPVLLVGPRPRFEEVGEVAHRAGRRATPVWYRRELVHRTVDAPAPALAVEDVLHGVITHERRRRRRPARGGSRLRLGRAAVVLAPPPPSSSPRDPSPLPLLLRGGGEMTSIVHRAIVAATTTTMMIVDAATGGEETPDLHAEDEEVRRQQRRQDGHHRRDAVRAPAADRGGGRGGGGGKGRCVPPPSFSRVGGGASATGGVGRRRWERAAAAVRQRHRCRQEQGFRGVGFFAREQ